MVMSVRPSVRPSGSRPGLRPGLHPSVTVFRTFLLHALTDSAEILHVTFFLWTFDQVRVSSISINFCRSYAPFGTQNTENTVFRSFLLHAVTYWAEILHMTLFYCTTDQVWVSSISVIGVMQLTILEIHNFPQFSPTCFEYLAEILHMTLFYCTTDQVWVSSIRVNFCGSYSPFGT